MADEKFSLRDFAVYFSLCWAVTVLVIASRLGRKLARDPIGPLDPQSLAVWRARRRWLITAEFIATPALALAAVLLAAMSGWRVEVAMVAAYAAALGGLPFLAHVLLTMVGQRLGVDIREARLPDEGGRDDGA